MIARIVLVLFASLVLASSVLAKEDAKPEPDSKVPLTSKTKRAFDRSPEQATVRQHPNGMTVVEFNGTRQLVMMSRIGPDGKAETFCTSSERAAHRFLTGVDRLGEEK